MGVQGDAPLRERRWNPLLGLLAVWLGMCWIVIRMASILAPVAALALAPAVLAGSIWGEPAFLPVMSVTGIVVLPLWLIPAFAFFFPAYVEQVRMGGILLQRAGLLRPADTLGAVNRRWDHMHQRGRCWWRVWRARD